jgi:hypothetical protein
MIGWKCSIVPIYFGNQALTDVNQEPAEKGWTNVLMDKSTHPT